MTGRLSYREREKLLQKAQRHFIRAAAGVTEGDLAFALIEGGLGLFAVSRADADMEAYQHVMDVLGREVADGG